MKSPWVAMPAFALAALLALACGALLICPDRSCPVPPFDTAGLRLMNGWRTASLDHGLRTISWFGSLFVLMPAAMLLARREWNGGRPRVAGFLVMALAGAALLAHLAKLLIDRPRPELFPPLVAMPHDASFPSAHAMQLTALLAAWLLSRGRRPGLVEVLAAMALIIGVGLSRVYLQVHFPSDVVFGVAVALFWVMALRNLPPWRKGGMLL